MNNQSGGISQISKGIICSISIPLNRSWDYIEQIRLKLELNKVVWNKLDLDEIKLNIME